MKPDQPDGMTDCERAGLSGLCGLDCPVIIDGRCPYGTDKEIIQQIIMEAGVEEY